jgi:hypothetical protein
VRGGSSRYRSRAISAPYAIQGKDISFPELGIPIEDLLDLSDDLQLALNRGM